jgi:flavin reductase (DIM6/NTAB) family NADH-FMN oxidoreductase RutF
MARAYRKRSYPPGRETGDNGRRALIAECYANFECRLRDTRMIRTYGLFIWEVVKAHVAVSPKRPQTIHYRGNGEFMISGGSISRRRKFRPENL